MRQEEDRRWERAAGGGEDGKGRREEMDRIAGGRGNEGGQ